MRKWPVNFGSSHWLGFYRYDFKYELSILHAHWADNMLTGQVTCPLGMLRIAFRLV